MCIAPDSSAEEKTDIAAFLPVKKNNNRVAISPNKYAKKEHKTGLVNFFTYIFDAMKVHITLKTGSKTPVRIDIPEPRLYVSSM